MSTHVQDSFGKFTMIRKERVAIIILSLVGLRCLLIWCLKFI